ncbi:hypothetical protein [Pontiella sp.]|uniref:hypothetical protein n=1 Tax=Pontiella sp. TaxID=2837462 RepID=UPI00356AB422
MKRMVFVVSVALAAGALAGQVKISSLDELASYAAQSGNKVRIAPGTYTVKKGYYPEDPKNYFQLQRFGQYL